MKKAAGVMDMKSSSRCEGQRKNSGLFRKDLKRKAGGSVVINQSDFSDMCLLSNLLTSNHSTEEKNVQDWKKMCFIYQECVLPILNHCITLTRAN